MGRKIVVVDDEADVVAYLTAVLGNEGYEVHTADSADRGMELIQQIDPDLICLDIMIPKKSGITLYTELRAMDRFKDTPVLIISGVAQSGEFDFRDYVTDKSIPPPQEYFEKPINVDSFLKAVKDLLKPGSTHRSSKV